MDWKLAAAVPVLLIIILGALFVMGQPKTNNTGNVGYTDVNGDEYLPGDYTSPDSNAAPIVSVPTGLGLDPTYPAGFKSCASLPAMQRDDCYTSYALRYNDRKGCDAVQDTTIKDNCLSGMATQTNDAGFCDQLHADKTDCYNGIALQTNNADLCKKDAEPKQQCYRAFEAKDTSLCPQEWDSGHCTGAIFDGNASECNLIEDSSSFCYYNIATQTNDASMCNKITDGTTSTCIFKIAVATNNVSLCENLTDSRDNCVAWIAFNTNNKDLCYKAGKEAQSCIADIEGTG